MLFGKAPEQDMLAKFAPDTLDGIKNAPEKAAQFNSPYIEPEHILLSAVEHPAFMKLIEACGADSKRIQEQVFKSLEPGDFHGQPEFSRHTIHLFENATKYAQDNKSDFVYPFHMLSAFFVDPKRPAAEALTANKVDANKLKEAQQKTATVSEEKQDKAATEAKDAEQQKNQSVLDIYTTDLTAKAKAGKLDPVVARDTEITRVMEILIRRTKNNPVLVGEAGVGKTAIAEGLAQNIVSGKAPEPLKDKRILVLDLSLIVAGAKHRGEFEERLNKLIKEIKGAAGQIILFIDEFHTIIGAGGGEGSLDASNILKPSLARGELQAIGATTVKEYRQYIEKDAAFERRFQRVMVNEPDKEGAIKMLQAVKPKYETFHKAQIGAEAIEAAVVLSQRYISDRFLPDKAIDVIDESCSRITLKNISPRNVTVNTVKEVISEWSGVPVASLTQDETDILMKLEELIHKKLIDQEPAVKVVAEAIRRNRAGLKNPKRPVGSFIFMGPTGVGKTQLAKRLAEVMFGSEDKMIRIDMSEYMEKNATARMIGAPPGYVGYEEGGQLTESVRKKPYSVVLFDEIEKAHKEVFNIFLQILDDGRLTDSKGRTVDFKNTIIICTSNIGTELIKQSNVNDPNLQKILLVELQKHFRPEFINRFDDIVSFRGLTPEDMKAIADIMVKEISELLKEQKITIEISDAAKDKLAKLGFDPVFGARPLRRLIQKLIENPLSSMIIEKKITTGTNVKVDVAPDGKFTFVPTSAAGAQTPTQNNPPPPSSASSSGTAGPPSTTPPTSTPTASPTEPQVPGPNPPLAEPPPPADGAVNHESALPQDDNTSTPASTNSGQSDQTTPPAMPPPPPAMPDITPPPDTQPQHMAIGQT